MDLRTPGVGRAGAKDAKPAGAEARNPEGVARFLRGTPPRRSGVSWPLVGLVTIGLGLLVTTTLLGESGLATHRRLAHERAAAAAEVEQLRAQRKELQARIDALNHDPAALERLAREKYGMKRPGEEVIEIVGDERLVDGQAAAIAPAAPGSRAADAARPTAPERVRPNLRPVWPAAPVGATALAGPGSSGAVAESPSAAGSARVGARVKPSAATPATGQAPPPSAGSRAPRSGRPAPRKPGR